MSLLTVVYAPRLCSTERRFEGVLVLKSLMLFSSDVKRVMSGTMTTPTGKVNEPETQKSSDEECFAAVC